jgi:hypothetical protein
LFDHYIRGAAKKDEVFDVVSAYQDQTSPAVDCHCVDDCKAGYAGATQPSKSTTRIASHQPVDHGDQAEDYDDCDCKLENQSAPFAEHRPAAPHFLTSPHLANLQFGRIAGKDNFF